MSRGTQEHAAWQSRLDGHPSSAAFNQWTQSALPNDWNATVQAIIAHQAAITDPRPTIQSSGEICDALSQTLPDTIVLCADLEAPTNHKRSRTAFTASDHSGSYVHCGVREHLMGAMCDGIAAHGGLRPVNVTYLAFADYERPAMRMAAVMGLPALFVFSHDSIGVGSNGPTHQPVEILASFRAMPNMKVFRPADAVETAEAWALAMEATDGPSLFALSRQPAMQVRRTTGDNLTARGAYVLHEADEVRDVTLLATGTEVGLAVAARQALAAKGVRAAVVSMPCWELFSAQDADYRSSVIGTAPRIGIEAAMQFGWERWLREDDHFIGMHSFGASDQSAKLFEHFGITVEAIVQAALRMTARNL